jgi:glycosyltransferase involved in cell wall biosynthesis
MPPAILVIIPAYNAARYLPDLIARISPHYPLDRVLVIDDGSRDGTGEVAAGLACRVLAFPVNQGKGAALKAGFDVAVREGFEAVITIDADLQHKPEHLTEFGRRYHTGDILIGTRAMGISIMPAERLLTNNLTSIIISIFGSTRVRDSQSGYRLIKTAVLRRMRLTSHRYDTESEMLFQAGYLRCSTAEVPIETVYAGSRSFINPVRDTGRFVRQIWKRLWY